MYDVITVGSGTVDVFVQTGDRLFGRPDLKRDTCHIPFGSKILIEDLRYDTGGGGTNTAVAFRRLGLKVAWLGKVGMDENADNILSSLKKERIDIKLVSRGKKPTGYSVILDAEGHDRTILAFKGCNDDLQYKDIPLRKLKTRWFYISSMIGESFSTIEKVCDFAEEHGISIAFNPSSYLVDKGPGFLDKILRRVAVLVYNKEEASLLVGAGTISQLLKRSYALGPKIIVITDGRNGAYCYDGKLIYRAPAHKLKVLESTGAGDAFAATFVSALIKGKDIKTALRWGIINSQSVITHYGAKNKLLSEKEIISGLRKSPIDVKARF